MVVFAFPAYRELEELQAALARVKTLRGLLPICSYCHRIRDDQDYWQYIERYLTEHSDARLSHGICPQCMKEQWGLAVALATRNDRGGQVRAVAVAARNVERGVDS